MLSQFDDHGQLSGTNMVGAAQQNSKVGANVQFYEMYVGYTELNNIDIQLVPLYIYVDVYLQMFIYS